MKTLVTGASGFVGSAVCRALCQEQHDVLAMVRSNSNTANLDDLPVSAVTADIRDAESVRKAVRGCDVVFHVAADYRLWVPDPDSMYAINVEGTRNVAQACIDAGIDRMVYTSSVATIRPFSDGKVADERQ